MFNPEGLYLSRDVTFHAGDIGHDNTGEEIPARSYRGGTWHWPERMVRPLFIRAPVGNLSISPP